MVFVVKALTCVHCFAELVFCVCLSGFLIIVWTSNIATALPLILVCQRFDLGLFCRTVPLSNISDVKLSVF